MYCLLWDTALFRGYDGKKSCFYGTGVSGRSLLSACVVCAQRSDSSAALGVRGLRRRCGGILSVQKVCPEDIPTPVKGQRQAGATDAGSAVGTYGKFKRCAV